MSNIEYERVNWENGTRTPLNANNLNNMDKTISEVVNYINKVGEYILLNSGWTNISSTGVYTYKYFISTSIYSDSDIPTCQPWGMHDIETQDEITSISYIKKVIVDSTGVTIYASSKPTVDLKLVLKV